MNDRLSLSSPVTVHGRAAFTLIELMVAAAITSLLLLGMTGVFDQAMKAWRLSSRRADAEREVRAALTLIQQDFGGLLLTNNLPILRITNSSDLSLIGPSLTPVLDGSVAVFFLTTRGGPTTDLAGVGYYVGYDTSTKTYNLYRYFRFGSNQLAAVTNYLAGNGILFPANTGGDELVGANVVNFRAEFKTLPALFGPVTSQDGPSITTRPGYVQLELTAYGSEAVRNFGSTNDWTMTNRIQQSGRTYLWRVDL